jgi:hypothetical protein
VAEMYLTLPDELVHRCRKSAEVLGISPTELIRMAVEHELAGSNRRMERAAMAKALQAMHRDPDYEQECAALDEGIVVGLPDEPEKWWQG